jgi:MoxR-like ATPase
MMLRVGYPSEREEIGMLHLRMNETTVERRVSPGDVSVLREFIRETVHVDDKILEYIVRLGRATRDPGQVGRPQLKELLQLGISPRSYQHVLALARVNAFLHGRTWALPADVKEIFVESARHRVARTVRAQAENVEPDEILTDVLRAVPIP